MVRIQVKYSSGDDGDGGGDNPKEENEFLYNCESNSTIEDITNGITEIANLQLQVQHLALHLLPRITPLIHTLPGVIHLHRALSEAQSYVSKEQVVHNKPLSSFVLRDHLRSIEKEFRMNYQASGYQDSNLTQLADSESLQEKTAQLWWAGKEFMKGKKLCDYIGKNDKTKIMVKLLSVSQAAASGNRSS